MCVCVCVNELRRSESQFRYYPQSLYAPNEKCLRNFLQFNKIMLSLDDDVRKQFCVYVDDTN